MRALGWGPTEWGAQDGTIIFALEGEQETVRYFFVQCWNTVRQATLASRL